MGLGPRHLSKSHISSKQVTQKLLEHSPLKLGPPAFHLRPKWTLKGTSPPFPKLHPGHRFHGKAMLSWDAKIVIFDLICFFFCFLFSGENLFCPFNGQQSIWETNAVHRPWQIGKDQKWPFSRRQWFKVGSQTPNTALPTCLFAPNCASY